MTTAAEFLARKQLLLQRLRQDDPGPHERDEIERLLAEIDAPLDLRRSGTETGSTDERRVRSLVGMGGKAPR